MSPRTSRNPSGPRKRAMKARQRHVPLRRCVTCGTRLPQRDLVRVVKTPQGQVVVDPTHKAAGRGAYLCRVPSCWEQGLKKNRLGHALRGTVSSEERRLLQEYAQTAVQPKNSD